MTNDFNLFDVLLKAAQERRRSAAAEAPPQPREVWTTPMRPYASCDLKTAEVLAIDGKPVRR